MAKKSQNDCITIRGAKQNNLKNITLSIPLNKITVITGVSGSGKSSLAFETIYAEGQRRYVATFSSYARQFLDRMDRPQVDRIDGIPPAIAINQINPVRTSRSTVGTMTELNDHLKLLFSRAAYLVCRKCGQKVNEDTSESIFKQLLKMQRSDYTLKEIVITFPAVIPHNFTSDEVREHLAAGGYHRILFKNDTSFDVIQDRCLLSKGNSDRIIEDLEAALKHGSGHVAVFPADETTESKRINFSSGFHCATCNIHYSKATANHFSFNSPIGACETCRGFGRVIGIDRDLVVPDGNLTLRKGAIKPFQSPSYRECQDDLMRFAKRSGIPVDVPWNRLSDKIRKWVFTGEGSWDDGVWYGVDRFFKWLESRNYKMHVRVLLSRYRAYHQCEACKGARLKSDALLWRIGTKRLNIHDVMQLPIDECFAFFSSLRLPAPHDDAAAIVLDEICTRLRYLVDVGLGYLTLDRQSRTLSGGEVQRINLTTALGTSLVNTLFILDEPSIGLHSRDIVRLIAILQRLRDTGNTLIIVEHDPELIRAADRVIDMGPGPGVSGGRLIFSGTLPQMVKNKRSLTADYLTGKRIVSTRQQRSVQKSSKTIAIIGATEHNLKNIDIYFPLNRIVGIAGVSGSGKSTLIEEILYRSLLRCKGTATESPGDHKTIIGSEYINEVVMVDQSAIGKTTRSNPVSYIGAFDPIRKLFASTEMAKNRNYTASTFSFNSGNGRCPLCNGAGYEKVEMQFLSDVYLVCSECHGKRFKREVLEVTVRGKSLFDILSMTVDEAFSFFADRPDITGPLEPLRAVGLSYLPLGQPLPTLSGGEAQRLKLAAHLPSGKKARNETTLFLFDEPTTGLHFADIAKLLSAFHTLIEAGHSVIIIEHNLDVLRSVDWLIELGPEGGNEGGSIVFTGTPDECIRQNVTHTGKALYDFTQTVSILHEPVGEYGDTSDVSLQRSNDMLITGAREHNLKSIDVTIPRNKFTVITGVSGSGKSTVAFDLLFAEGQRRYLESLNAYARQFVQPPPRPDVDVISGIPPTVAIEQRTSRGGRKSTIATVTEIYHYIRLLFVKLGTQYCPACNVPVGAQSPEAILDTLLALDKNSSVTFLAPLIINRKGIYKDLAQSALHKGYTHLRVDGTLLPTEKWPRLDRYKEHTIELPVQTIRTGSISKKELRAVIAQTLTLGNGFLHTKIKRSRGNSEYLVYSIKRTCPKCQRGFNEPDPRLFSYNSRHGWCPDCFGTGLQLSGFDEEQSGEEIWWNEWWDGDARTCTLCNGQRLNEEALSVRLQDHTIAELNALSVDDAITHFKSISFSGRDAELATNILPEIQSRLSFLSAVGLGYISLDRAAPTLSGGEAQRVRLAGQLGSNLRGVCYILDEPTIGLHSRDNNRLLDTLRSLQKQGNSVVVVEHDEDTIRHADYLIDLGPGGGSRGGIITAHGTKAAVLRNKNSITARFFRKKRTFNYSPRSVKNGNWLIIHKADLHNLRKINARFPLGRLVCVTGVSGSGKSTLLRDILHDNIAHLLSPRRRKPSNFFGCHKIDGWDNITRVLEVDQRPIGKTPRSCPATYVGFWDTIRKLFAKAPESLLRGYTASRFSFNTDEGRCPICQGQGVQKIAMNFLPDVTVRCDVCNGKRFTGDTLAVTFKDKTIADVLNMNVDEALPFFAAHPTIHHSLQLLQEVGLGYLTLGQQSPTLSGGEAQRIKLVTELSKVQPAHRKNIRQRKNGTDKHTMFILDEPTVGLHKADIENLMTVLHRLVDTGNSVIIIEHNLDVVAQADWVIDLGPEGGSGGGEIVAEGTPREIAEKRKKSYTGEFIWRYFNK